MKKQLLRVLLASAALCSVAPPAAAAEVPIFFDFFFSDNLGIPAQNFNTFIQWNVTGGSVDLVGGVGPGVFGAPPRQPLGRYVDLGGSTGDPGLFATRLSYPVLPGATYNFRFDYRSTGGDLNTATAFIGGESFTVSTAATDFTRFSRDLTFASPGLVNISVQGDEFDLDGSGIGIDGIVFSQVLGVGGGDPGGPGLPPGAAVPEPASWALMILGFGLVGTTMRRRSVQTV